jgi:hypothetical protein
VEGRLTKEEFVERLDSGGTVRLSATEWSHLSSHFAVVERHDTQLAGDLLIVEAAGRVIAVEAPSRDARVARLLGGRKEATEFVQRRFEEYERMWDGCGVKVEYYG